MSSASPTTTEAPAPAETPVSTPPVDPPRRRRRQGPPLFSGADQPGSQDSSRPETGPMPGPELDGRNGDGSDGWSDPTDPGVRQPSGGRSSSPKGPFSKAELRRAISGGVQGVTILAHQNLARDEVDEELERFIATEDEADHLAEPLANLAGRRMNGPGGALNPDLVDVINALVVVATYVTRQLRLRTTARALRRGAPVEQQPPADDQVTDAP